LRAYAPGEALIRAQTDPQTFSLLPVERVNQWRPHVSPPACASEGASDGAG
jgi:hypothetical protein